ncbi:hypothetical protein HYZ70_03460 [Candidatus Curtissbacteria bacterium]|nr:hypothetical protein [Candidatus Curtissbacteria bacterium]
MQNNKNDVKKQLAELKQVLVKATVGDFTSNVNIPEDMEEELTDIFVGIKIVLETIREKMERLRQLENENQALKEKLRQIETKRGSLT